jgi:hypothetical protein
MKNEIGFMIFKQSAAKFGQRLFEFSLYQLDFKSTLKNFYSLGACLHAPEVGNKSIINMVNKSPPE